MKITFFGAAREVTGSMHLITINGSRVLLDCGLCQGKRKKAFERNRNLPFDARSIDACVLSHAHIDHSGNLPTLVNRGFSGRIFATPATEDLCDIMLRDSVYLQLRDVRYVNKKRKKQGKTLFEPLALPEDVERAMKHFESVPYDTKREVVPGLEITFHDAGHILGSAVTAIDLKEKGNSARLLFTGDLGRKKMPILRDPEVVHNVDYLITESTYGDRLHPPREDVKGALRELVSETAERRSRLLIPAFSVGRTQQVVYFLRELYAAGEIPHIPVFLDSPLSSRATDVYEKHDECYDAEALRIVLEGDEPFTFRGLKYTADVEDSKALNHAEGPVIIISASGMCEGGRILHHLLHIIEDARNAILFVGYQAENTLGRRIVEHRKPIRIFGDEYRLRAKVYSINGLSAHADRNELLDYFKQMGPKVSRCYVVHGEMDQAKPFSEAIRDLGVKDVQIPQRGQTVEL
ncbi:MBL fold metallo-hydrolase [bacterium]|nr:MBL fold metallo-hydrolase [bacterium]